MKWSEIYHSDKTPSYEDIEKFIGKGSEMWREMRLYIEQTYASKPQMSYSKCSAQPGWNVKYSKSGKSLCTLYPMEGYFIALIVVGAKEETEVELAQQTFNPYLQGLYAKTAFSCGGRWLMIEVKDKAVLNDVKRLINIRVKPKAS